MSVDKFGRYSSRNKTDKSDIKSLTTALTIDSRDNSLNVHFNRIKNLKDPKENEDAATKRFVDKRLNENQSTIENSIKNCEIRYEKTLESISEKINNRFNEMYEALYAKVILTLQENKNIILNNNDFFKYNVTPNEFEKGKTTLTFKPESTQHQ